MVLETLRVRYNYTLTVNSLTPRKTLWEKHWCNVSVYFAIGICGYCELTYECRSFLRHIIYTNFSLEHSHAWLNLCLFCQKCKTNLFSDHAWWFFFKQTLKYKIVLKPQNTWSQVKTKIISGLSYTFTSTVLSGEYRPVFKFVTSALEMTAFFSNPEPDWCWIDKNVYYARYNWHAKTSLLGEI